MVATIRKFEAKDIPYKVKWINNSDNNQYLHYELPLEIKKTEQWFENNEDNSNRYDAVIEVDGNSVGLIGLLNINDFKAEYYITIGDSAYRGNNIALKASKLLLEYSYNYLGLNMIYLFTEIENIPMQKLADKIGMYKEATLTDYLFRDESYRNCYYYTLKKTDYLNQVRLPNEILSDIHCIEKDDHENTLYIKRDDLIPFSFGGNKARKSKYFFDEILREKYNTVVTYGSKSSNHCRIVSNLCAKYGLNCVIISPHSKEPENFNNDLIQITEAEIINCEVDNVSDTITQTINERTLLGDKVYFIPGGGHGNIGTQAYVDAYHEIILWERHNKIRLDYVFLATGTGTTQAGLVAGQLLNKDYNRKIIGISIARDKDRGSQVVSDSIEDYFNSIDYNFLGDYEKYVIFLDQYKNEGYGIANREIYRALKNAYINHGILLNSTYTGKAYLGMQKYIESENIQRKNILFINTGGAPLFLNDLANIN